MERLTTRSSGPLPVLVRGKAFGPAYFMSEHDYEDYRDALNKLAAYEDTGLEPDSIEEAKEAVGRAAIELAYYHKAEQEGRLLVLPCKVGDTVYIIMDGKIYEREVYHISYSDYYGKVTSAVWARNDFLTSGIGAAFEGFGKTAFLTRAAAEAKLKEEV